MESLYCDLPLHCSVGWLSRGEVLLRFVEYLVEIKAFLIGQGNPYPKLLEENRLVKLMFLVDITTHLNELNLRLHGPRKTVIGLFEAWKDFVAQLDVYTWDIQTATFCYYKHLKAFSVDHQVNGAEIDIYMKDLTSQFRNRFHDFQRFGPLFSFLINPQGSKDLELSAFEWMNIEDFQMQLIDFKASLLWASKFDDLRKSLKTAENSQTSIFACWKSLQEKFDCLKKMVIALLSIFGSTYLCEQIFSQMKFILSSHCSRFTEDYSGHVFNSKLPDSPNITELKAMTNISLEMTLVTAISFFSLIKLID